MRRAVRSGRTWRERSRRLELARWDDLPDAELPWREVSDRAAVQGISEADVIWDMSGRKKEPRAARIKVQGLATGRRPAKRAQQRPRCSEPDAASADSCQL